ncbi:MAG: PA14 domain-containing protein [Draconibacterium sp.]
MALNVSENRICTYAPFSLDITMIQAIAYKESLFPSYIKSGKVRFVDPAINGINYKVYEGEWKDKPDLSKLREVSNGRQFDFDVKRIEKREDYVAIEFYGFIQIKKAGVYSFSSWANDGSWVFINNKLMADTPAGTLSGDIRLAEGKYPIRVIYFESTGTESLNVLMSGPGIEKQAIAESLLFFAN